MGTLSRALDALAPISCTIVDNRGDEVLLTSAGYVLRPGKSYRVRIVLPCGEDELKDAHLAAPPDYLQVDEQVESGEENGHPVRLMSFHVSSSSLLGGLNLIRLRSNELRVVYKIERGNHTASEEQICPVIVKPLGVRLIWVLIISLIVPIIAEMVSDVVLEGRSPEGGLKGFVYRLLSWESLGLFFSVAAGLGLVIFVVNLAQAHYRARELRRHFRETYDWDNV